MIEFYFLGKNKIEKFQFQIESNEQNKKLLFKIIQSMSKLQNMSSNTLPEPDQVKTLRYKTPKKNTLDYIKEKPSAVEELEYGTGKKSPSPKQIVQNINYNGNSKHVSVNPINFRKEFTSILNRLNNIIDKLTPPNQPIERHVYRPSYYFDD